MVLVSDEVFGSLVCLYRDRVLVGLVGLGNDLFLLGCLP